MKRENPVQGWTIYNQRPQLVRGVYLTVLLIAIAFSTIWMYRFASVTTDENLYTDIEGKVTIIEIVEGGVSDLAGLRLGDVIVAVNGNPVKNRFDANDYLVRGRGGEVLEYRIERDGKTMDIRVVTADYGLPIFYIALALTALVFFITGAYVILKRPQYPIARLFGWSHLAAGTILLISKDISFQQYPDAITTIGLFLPRVLWPLTISAFMHLFLYFPVPRFVKPLPQTTFVIMYVVPLSAMFLAIIVFLTTIAKSPWGFYLFLVITATIIGIQLYIARSMKNYQSVEYRQRNRWVVLAAGFSVVFVGGISTFTSFGAWQIIFFSGIVIPGLLFGTVIRQRIFDLYVVVRKGSMYTGLSIAFTALILLLFLLALFMLPSQTLNVPVLNITSEHLEIIRLDLLDAEHRAVFERRLFFIVGTLFFIGFWWLYKRGRQMLDDRFYRGSLDYKSALSTFSKLSHSYLDNLTLAETVVHDLVSLMRLKSAVFLSRSEDALVPLADNRLSAGSESLILRRDDIATLAPYFEKSHCVAADNLPLRERFADAGVEFLTAVRTNGEIEALLMLGEKQSETNYTREDIELLDNLATNVADALMTMRFYEGAREKERLRKELEIARRIQLASLPSEIPELPGIDIAAHSMPAHEVGGDFYDFLPRYDSTTFIIGDVSGKGTPAAMYLARIQGIVKTIESYQPSLWELLVRLNTQIFDHIEKKSYLTMAGLRVDLLKNEVTYLRAGHLPLVHYNALNREVTLHQPQGMGIGLDRHMFAEHLEEEKIFVRGGDILLLVSDGITEAVNEDGEQFDFTGATASIAENAGGSAQQILEALFAAVGRFTGSAERHDDATAVVIKFAVPRSAEGLNA